MLVAKHGCGFVTWPSTAKLPNGSRYGYSVAYSNWQGGAGDVLKSFKESCLKKGMGVGYYYSLGSSQYAGRLGLSPAQLQVLAASLPTCIGSNVFGSHGAPAACSTQHCPCARFANQVNHCPTFLLSMRMAAP